MKNIFFIILFLFSFNSYSAGSKIDIPKYDWSWKGFFGTYDRASAQRGLKVYREVCAGCHSMNYLSYRNLGDLGFSEDHIKAIAAENLILDGPNDEGEMFERDGLPSDQFVNPYANNKAARAANNGAYPPDLSLIVKSAILSKFLFSKTFMPNSEIVVGKSSCFISTNNCLID